MKNSIRNTVRLASVVIAGGLQTAVFAAVCNGEAAGDTLNAKPKDGPDALYPAVSPADTLWMIVKVILVLAFIIGIFYLLMKFISKKNAIFGGRSIRSLGGVPLGQNKSIQVIEIGKSLYIVGVGQDIQLLEKIDNEEDVADLIELLTAGPAVPAVSFEAIGGWLRGLKKQRVEEEEEMELPASFGQVFHEKMQHMTDRNKMLEDLLMKDNPRDRSNNK